MAGRLLGLGGIVDNTAPRKERFVHGRTVPGTFSLLGCESSLEPFDQRPASFHRLGMDGRRLRDIPPQWGHVVS